MVEGGQSDRQAVVWQPSVRVRDKVVGIPVDCPRVTPTQGQGLAAPMLLSGQLISNFSIILMSSEEQGTPLLLYLPVYTWVFYHLHFSGSRIFFLLSVRQRSVLNMRPTRKPSRIPPFVSSESVCPWLAFLLIRASTPLLSLCGCTPTSESRGL